MTATSSPCWIDPLVELLKAGPSIVTAVVAVYGLSIAKAGLTKWRSETIGKRKAEVAEQVLAGFYEARDILAHARSPMSWGDEGSTRPPAVNETETDRSLLNSYFRTVERLNKKNEFFAHLAARRYSFIALFGADAAKPFDEVFGIRQSVLLAVQMLSQTHMQTRGMLRERAPAESEWENTIGWGVTDDDKIARRIDAAVAAMEAACRPAIQEFER
jgi:hypothetical protein